MEHPPKQGLKRENDRKSCGNEGVLMEHPPKQGLKPHNDSSPIAFCLVLMEHPPKQGLKHKSGWSMQLVKKCFNGTSTKTRIETRFWKRFSTRDSEF